MEESLSSKCSLELICTQTKSLLKENIQKLTNRDKDDLGKLITVPMKLSENSKDKDKVNIIRAVPDFPLNLPTTAYMNSP